MSLYSDADSRFDAHSGGGWCGMNAHVLHALRVVRADTDDEGRFLVRGTIVSFMGAGEEVVVGADAEYSSDGQWRGLAGLMNSTSYGVHNVTVL